MAVHPHLPTARRVLGHVAATSRRWVVWRPVALALLAVAAAAGTLAIDAAVALPVDDLIGVDTARSFLSAVAGTMVTATVVLFWIRGMIVGTHSSHMPTRILTDYLGDRYQQWVMGFMIAVLVFFTVVLFGLPSPSPGTDADAPVVSVVAAVVLLVVALLIIVQSIDTGSRAMHEERILLRIVDEALRVIERVYPEKIEESQPPPDHDPSTGDKVWSEGVGWVQAIDDVAILRALPPGSVCHRLVRTGEFVTPATQLCRVALPDGASMEPGAPEEVARSMSLANARSPRHDIALALRSIVDVALAGLASGGPDRTTAREAIVHIGAILRPLLIRDGPPTAWHHEERWMVIDGDSEFERFANQAFEDLRHADPDPLTARTIIATINDLVEVADDSGRHDRAQVLRRHADLVINQIRHRAADDGEVRWITGTPTARIVEAQQDAVRSGDGGS